MSDNDVVISFFLSVVAFYSACMAFANLGCTTTAGIRH
jgi:hypothetical protein